MVKSAGMLYSAVGIQRASQASSNGWIRRRCSGACAGVCMKAKLMAWDSLSGGAVGAKHLSDGAVGKCDGSYKTSG